MKTLFPKKGGEAPRRPHTLQVRLTPEEKAMLEAMAKADGCTLSGWLRGAIAVEHRKLQEEQQGQLEPCELCRKKVPLGQRLNCTAGDEVIAVAGAFCKGCFDKAMGLVKQQYPNATGELVSLSGKPIV